MSKESGDFSYMNGDNGIGRRWITHDPDGNAAGAFDSEEEARAAAERWNKHDGNLVRVDWKAPPDNAPDSNRGNYTVCVPAAEWSKRTAGGWHAMEHATHLAQSIRDSIAEHGKDATIGILKATR